MSAEEKPKCCAKVYGGGYWPHPCGRNAKVERDGRYYCGTHDPEAVKSRREKSYSQWMAKHAAENAIREREERKREEQAFKASMFDGMLALLIRYRNEVPLGHQPHMIAHEADAAIAKATNQQGNNHD